MKKLLATLVAASLSAGALASNFIRVPVATITGTVQVHPAVQGLGTGLPTPQVPPVVDETPARITLSQASLSFGEKNVGGGASVPQSITISNSGDKSTPIIVGTGDGAPYSIASSTCSSVLAGGSSCAVSVAFQPVTYSPSIPGALTVQASDGIHSVGLSGSGISGLYGEISVESISSPGATLQVGVPAGILIMIRNSGTGLLTLRSASAPGFTVPYVSGVQFCKTTPMEPNLFCTFRVAYTPTSVGPISLPGVLNVTMMSNKYGETEVVAIPFVFAGTVTKPASN